MSDSLRTGTIQVVGCASSLALPIGYASDFDVMIADAPYREHVHATAISQSKSRGTRKRDLGFVSLTRAARRAVARWSSEVRRWSVAYSDVEHANWLSLAAQAHGTDYVRTVPWVRWSAPYLPGTAPPQGFESILLFHPKTPRHWNGPGNLTHFDHSALRGEDKHKAEKPLDQALDLVSFFSDAGERVFDPFAGSAVVGMACRILQRGYVGYENDPEWAARGNARLSGPLSPRDRDRLLRWIDADSEPVSALKEGPSLIRARSRALDKEFARTWLSQAV